MQYRLVGIETEFEHDLFDAYSQSLYTTTTNDICKFIFFRHYVRTRQHLDSLGLHKQLHDHIEGEIVECPGIAMIKLWCKEWRNYIC